MQSILVLLHCIIRIAFIIAPPPFSLVRHTARRPMPGNPPAKKRRGESNLWSLVTGTQGRAIIDKIGQLVIITIWLVATIIGLLRLRRLQKRRNIYSNSSSRFETLRGQIERNHTPIIPQQPVFHVCNPLFTPSILFHSRAHRQVRLSTARNLRSIWSRRIVGTRITSCAVDTVTLAQTTFLL